jgi:hypothetical protein
VPSQLTGTIGAKPTASERGPLRHPDMRAAGEEWFQWSVTILGRDDPYCCGARGRNLAKQALGAYVAECRNKSVGGNTGDDKTDC